MTHDVAAIQQREAECIHKIEGLPAREQSMIGNEPHRLEWDHPSGLVCLMVRHPSLLHWCGYVGVPKTHPDFGHGYDDVDVRAHGGLTYAAKCAHTICHIPKGPDDERWWFGMDFAHAGDYSPGMGALRSAMPAFLADYHSKDKYRDVMYVKNEVNRLADALAERAFV